MKQHPDYSEDNLRERVIHVEGIYEYWQKVWPIIIMALAVLEICIIITGFGSFMSLCRLEYLGAIGIKKVMWSIVPTFAFLNGLFLAGFTSYFAYSAFRNPQRRRS